MWLGTPRYNHLVNCWGLCNSCLRKLLVAGEKTIILQEIKHEKNRIGTRFRPPSSYGVR